MLRADAVYQGTVTNACLMASKAKKTPGFQIFIETEDGENADHTIWLTPKNKDRAKADFETLGVDTAKLSSRAFIEHELPQAVIGKAVEFGTKSEEYNGQVRVKVSWLSPVGAADSGELAAEVAHIFGAPKPEPKNEDDEDPIHF
jgi:hypothetical protein